MVDKEYTILLNEATQLQQYFKVIQLFDFEIDIRSMDRRQLLDGKSIMGVMSLDLSNPIIVIPKTDNINEINQFTAVMRQFQIEER